MKIRSIAVNDNTAAMLEYLYGNNKAKKETFIEQAVDLYFDIAFGAMAIHDLQGDYLCKHPYLKHLHKDTYECMVCGMEFEYIPRF